MAPAGKIMGPNVDKISVSCKPNILGDKLPDWVIEPYIDSNTITYCLG